MLLGAEGSITFTACLLSNLHVIGELKCVQTDSFRESNHEHCETAMLIEKKSSFLFLACHFLIYGQSIII